jgi:hypothetical protein
MNDNQFSLKKSYKLILEKELLKGGLADNKTIQDVAKKHNKTIKYIQGQLEKGIKVESEHTNNKKLQKEIAMDHLWEDAEYYIKLQKIESKKSKKIQENQSLFATSANEPVPELSDTSFFNIKDEVINRIVDNSIKSYKKLKKSKMQYVKEVQEEKTNIQEEIKELYTKFIPEYDTLANTTLVNIQHYKKAGILMIRDKWAFKSLKECFYYLEKATIDEKDEKFLNIFLFIQSVANINVEYSKLHTPIRPNPLDTENTEQRSQNINFYQPRLTAQQSPTDIPHYKQVDAHSQQYNAATDHTKQVYTVSPYTRDDVMIAPIFETTKNYNDCVKKLKQIASAKNSNNIDINSLKANIAPFLQGPLGKVIKFLLLNDDTVKSFPFNTALLKLQQQKQQIEQLLQMNKANDILEQQFSKDIIKESTSLFKLYKNWTKIKK